MISSVTGRVTSVGLDQVVIEVGGVGLTVRTTIGTAEGLALGAGATLSTSLVVREDSLTLYGFATATERDLFDVVQTVSGVGPRLALAMLAVHPPQVLCTAITTGQVAVLTKVPGIGKKSAERLVLELRDKVSGWARSSSTVEIAAESDQMDWSEQVLQALVGLGWSTKQAEGAMARVAQAPHAPSSVPQALRAALQELGR
ncbi:Holliday junction ATP-dependent DNA helicase RuvA [Austwickia sp. TVS 96-490-7B]|uniref:Holliday junction branch migration protein RuvA n=1 Tax=Austwickia sp. TVS 96-490-7B TaxID=2830843 RepID=UPI001C5A57D0|nr:Holliday junction branch migration protein RuvA [Austwickia sp. TVS 96-490-7B]MBW3086305.1 Holliday junction ATP-dependent DNA helicase RuvA [Austwickia sp. TVS 96-490-7B]